MPCTGLRTDVGLRHEDRAAQAAAAAFREAGLSEVVRPLSRGETVNL